MKIKLWFILLEVIGFVCLAMANIDLFWWAVYIGNGLAILINLVQNRVTFKEGENNKLLLQSLCLMIFAGFIVIPYFVVALILRWDNEEE